MAYKNMKIYVKSTSGLCASITAWPAAQLPYLSELDTILTLGNQMMREMMDVNLVMFLLCS